MDEMMSVIPASPEELTQQYVDDCRDTIHIVGSIINEVMARQEEDRIVKWVKKVGKQFVTKSAIEQSLVSMRTTAFVFGDNHPETEWYDYEEEMAEPQQPYERYIGL